MDQWGNWLPKLDIFFCFLKKKLSCFSTKTLKKKFIFKILKKVFFYSVATSAHVLGKVHCDSIVTHEWPKAQWKALCWLSGEHFWGPGSSGRKAFVWCFPPLASFWALWKWGHSKQTIHSTERIMMNTYTGWKK